LRERAGDRFAAKGDDEGLAPEQVDIGRDRPEQRHEMCELKASNMVFSILSSVFGFFVAKRLSRRSQMVRRIFTRAKLLSFASTSVQGAVPVLVRSTMSHTAA
jgi:hypothetical protein